MDRSELNGREELSEFEPLRFLIFGASIVSDWGNPMATTSRAVARALTALGHEVVFLEQRRNAPTVGLLEHRGYGPVRDFTKRYPDVRYRTYDIPPPREQSVWLGREATTSDVMIVLADAPAEVKDGLEALDLPFVLSLIENLPASTSERLLLTGMHASEIGAEFGPAVIRGAESGSLPRSHRVLLVAYDDAPLARETAMALEAFAPRLALAGQADLADWLFVPELALPDLYRDADVVVVAGAGRERGSLARFLLPASLGAQVVAVEPEGVGDVAVEGLVVAAPASVAAAVERAGEPGAAPDQLTISEAHDAATIAERLVDVVVKARLLST